MKFSIIPILTVAILIISSCSKDDDTASEIPIVKPNGDENYLNTDSDYIFDQNKLHTFYLTLPESALSKLNEDPAAEVYEEGTLTFEGETISPVGIRYKGSVGGWVGCLSGDDPLNPSGFKTCTKLSMKIKINWEGRDEKFFKLKKLQFKSMNSDPSQMRERLGYWLFRQMGTPAPRAVHAKLNINGKYAGVFSLLEEVDNRFIKENYDDDDGNLYKEIWPLSMGGVPYSDQEYIDALKTNEDDNPDVSLIKKLGKSIVDAELSEAKDIVEKYLDMDEIISYAVVDRAIGHDDGPFHWYCIGEGGCTNHNYYWYEETSEQKLHLIAWDLDLAFENIISDVNIVTPIPDAWGETSNNCEPFVYSAFPQWSASCDKLTATWTSYTELYEQKKLELLSGPMSITSTDEMISLWQNQIREATREASNLYEDAVSIEEWDAKVIELKNQLEHSRSN